MTNDQYFPLEVNLMHNDEIINLIDEMGMEGFGIYFHLLTELRKRDNYRCNMRSLGKIAHVLFTEQEKVERVVRDFSLFSMEEQADKVFFSSPYLDRVMKGLEEKRAKLSQAGRKSALLRSMAKIQPGCNQVATEEKSKEEKSKEKKSSGGEESTTTTTMTIVDLDVSRLEPFRSWETYVDEAFSDQYWMELQAMASGFGLDFFKFQHIIVESFRTHIRTQGTEHEICSLRCAKSYFANFIRRGTRTNKWVAELLEKERNRLQKENPYRYETVDPVTNARSYFGIPIPADAPPRPSENAMWNKEAFIWSE